MRPVGAWLLLAHETKCRALCRTQAMRSEARREVPPPTAHSAVGRWTQLVLGLDVLSPPPADKTRRVRSGDVNSLNESWRPAKARTPCI